MARKWSSKAKYAVENANLTFAWPSQKAGKMRVAGCWCRDVLCTGSKCHTLSSRYRRSSSWPGGQAHSHICNMRDMMMTDRSLLLVQAPLGKP